LRCTVQAVLVPPVPPHGASDDIACISCDG